MPPPSACLITLEGGEGAGKSTQAGRLAAALSATGLAVVTTREPGGAPGAEEIRVLLVDGDSGRWDPLSEALLHFAARREHLRQTILPALERGSWVISDRFADSTMAYQGSGLRLDRKIIEFLYDCVAGDLQPDLTIILDLPVEEGLARASARAGGGMRYEGMGLDFHRRLREGFLDIARREPARCAVVDAARNVDQVGEDILAAVRERLGPQGL